MTDILDFLPIRRETRHRIRARLDADVNAGRSPEDPAWLDTIEGGFYWDATQPGVLELERLWDMASVELPAVVFLPFSYGTYLDRWGEVLDTPRKAATRASGVERFTGTDGTFVPTNVEVGVPTVGEEEPVVFVTTTSGTVTGGYVDLAIEAQELGTTGNVVPGAVSLLLSSVPGITDVDNAASISGGADVESDEAYLGRLLKVATGVQGPGTVDDYEQWATEEPGVGFATVTAEDPAPGFVRIVLTDSLNDAVSQAIIDSLRDRLDPVSASGTLSGSHTFPQATITLTGANSTAAFLDQGYVLVGGSQVIRYTGKTSTTLTGCTGGTGTFVGGTAVEQSGQASGQAPVGARTLIQTPAQKVVDIEGTVALADGYSLTGTGGTIAVGELIEDALGRYINSLKPGEDVIVKKIDALLFTVRGVMDTSNVRIRIPPAAFAASNITMGVLDVAQLGDVTLTETPYVDN